MRQFVCVKCGTPRNPWRGQCPICGGMVTRSEWNPKPPFPEEQGLTDMAVFTVVFIASVGIAICAGLVCRAFYLMLSS